MTVKEQFTVVGLPTTWGSTKFRDWRPAQDALAARRLTPAGAIVIGKTNVPVGLWQSYNPVNGTTTNPWVSAALRCPAHFCGVFAHKSSIGLIPERGSGPPETPAIPGSAYMSVIGPMARSAADRALELPVPAGPDELGDGIGSARLQQASEQRLIALGNDLRDTVAR